MNAIDSAGLAPEWLALAKVALALAASLTGHIVSQRLTHAHVLPYKVSLASGFAVLIIIEALAFRPGGQWLLFGDVVMFCAGWFIFLNFVQAGQSSLRVRILLELRMAGADGLSHDDLHARYNDQIIMRQRLDRLVSGGAVVKRDGRLWVASPSLGVLIGIMRALKQLYLNRSSEFDDGRRS